MMDLLAGAVIAVDVQHAHRIVDDTDRGATFLVDGGAHVTEVDLAEVYAFQLARELRNRGATVIDNTTMRGTYAQRAGIASAKGAHAYLACHVNAGGGDYGLVEHIAPRFAVPTPFEREAITLATVLARRLEPMTGRSFARRIAAGQRGWICIGNAHGLGMTAALLEPFFGDHPPHMRAIGSPLGLGRIGAALAAGVIEWWQGRRARAGGD